MVVKNPIIIIDRISIDYHEYTRDKVISLGKTNVIRAVNNATLTIVEGEHVAIIGRNGSGKTTLLKCIAGLLRPASGTLETYGRIIYLAGVDPGFDGELTGRENIRQLALAYGINKKAIPEFIESVKEFTELGDAFERKYSGYSGGMKGKLGFGFISDLRSDVLLIDETFGAGDREFKKKSRAKMNAMVSEIPSLIMCTHGLNLAADVCERGLVMDKGELVFDGPIIDAISHYKRITEDSINWIEFPYQMKYVSEEGLFFDFTKEFKVDEELRLVIHDNKMKEFVFVEEIDTGKTITIPKSSLPEHLDCMFKLQQYREGKWYDASRYVRLTTEKIDEEE